MAGIYLHIPFCKQKCTYCDFHFSTTFESYRQKMVNSMCNEIRRRTKLFLENETLTTLYFGGGTPSLLSQDELNQLIQTIQETINCSSLEEVTLEANPDDINPEKLREWEKAGINRLSIGLQSFRQEDLDWMNRAHTVNEGESSIRLAQEHGFTNLTVDLMYGLPNLTEEEWRKTIKRLIQLNVPHISAYCLTVEQKTALSKMVQSGKIQPSTEEAQATQFEILIATMEENGYEQYEISNFCKPGFESKHNSNYWRNEIFLGIGPSAHSFDRYKRYWNVANNMQYMKALQEGKLAHEEEILSPQNRFNEYVLTGLRAKWGVNLTVLNSIHLVSNSFHANVSDFIAAGEMIAIGENLYLSPKGRLKADFIAMRLFI